MGDFINLYLRLIQISRQTVPRADNLKLPKLIKTEISYN
jgi:hypothetical protein